MVQATISLTLHFNHQHLGTLQSSLPYKKFLHGKKLDTLKLTLLYIQQYAPYTECLVLHIVTHM